MEEVCEIGHKNCERIFGTEKLFSSTKSFSLFPGIETFSLFMSTLKPDNFMQLF